MSTATYDGDGLRTSTTTTPAGSSATSQTYLWDTSGSTPQLVMDSNNAYIYGPSTSPIEQVDLSSGTITYLVSDRLGSIRGTVNTSGTLTNSTSYDAWGNPQTSGGLTSNTPLGYAGNYTDPTGLTYNIRRYYDPATGQFIGVDPLVDQTDAPYAYVNGDPVDAIDPLGLGLGDLFNPWSPHNPIRQWAAGGSLASNILYLNPAFPAVAGYGAEAQAWENGCSLWTVAGYGAAGTLGLASLALWFPTSAALSATEVTTVTIGPKIAGQMEARGWTDEAIEEAMSSGKQVRAINKANGNPATRYINPTTGQSVVVDDVTGQVIQVGGPRFHFGPGSGDVP